MAASTGDADGKFCAVLEAASAFCADLDAGEFEPVIKSASAALASADAVREFSSRICGPFRAGRTAGLDALMPDWLKVDGAERNGGTFQSSVAAFLGAVSLDRIGIASLDASLNIPSLR